MKISSDELRSKLQYVQRGTRKGGADFYKQALLHYDGQRLSLRSFNGIAHSIVRLADHDFATAAGTMLLDLDRLIGAMSRIEGDVELELDMPGTSILVRGSGARLVHKGYVDDGFIDAPARPENMVQVEGAGELAEQIGKASVAIDPSSPNDRFRGMYLTANGQVEFVGTNGTILSLVRAETNGLGYEGDAIVPVESLGQIRSVLGAGNSPYLAIEPHAIAAANGDYALVSTLVAGRFPNYSGLVLGRESCDIVKADRKSLTRALRIAQGYTGMYAAVYLELAESELTVRGEEAEKGDARCRVGIESKKPVAHTLKASAEKMLDGVQAISSNSVDILIPKQATPNLIALLPEGDDDIRVSIALMRRV